MYMKTRVRARKHKRKGEIQEMVLDIVKLAGVISMSVIAPNAVKLMRKRKIPMTHRDTELVRRAQTKLIDRGLLDVKSGGSVRVSDKGLRYMERIESSHEGLLVPSRWDGKWHVLIFDIPEKKKTTRDRLRRTLLSIGFHSLQDSVWVYPYECRDFISLLKIDFDLGTEVLYLIVEHIEKEENLKKVFSLR